MSLPLRQDGRALNEARTMSLSAGELSGAGGSARYRAGGSCALAVIHGPSTAKASAERHDAATIAVSVHRPSTVHTAGSGASRLLALREKRRQACDDSRLAALLRRCLMTVIEIERFPRSVISVTVQILQHDGSVDAVCINAVMAALLNAAIPCRTTMCAASSAVVLAAEGQLHSAVDLSRREEDDATMALPTDGSGSASLPVLARGTFVFSYPAPFGVIATSDVVFAPPSEETLASATTTVDLLTMLQQSAALVANETLGYMKAKCAGQVIDASAASGVVGKADG